MKKMKPIWENITLVFSVSYTKLLAPSCAKVGQINSWWVFLTYVRTTCELFKKNFSNRLIWHVV